jgi:N-dimethylarginine dimethylaminohydrolase
MKNGSGDSTAVRTMEGPAFLLNVPFSLETRVANNASMRKLGARGRRIDRARMMGQWRALHAHMAARSLVYLLPSRAGLQDQPFVANLAVVPPHVKTPLAVGARFRAPARCGESPVGRDFFRAMGFVVEQPPAFFEGEADLKFLRGNLYFGGHGLRSSSKAHAWLEKKHRFRIVLVPLMDPHLYHLDCVLHVLGRERVMLATAAVPAAVRRAVGRVAEIIDVPLPLAYRGATNIARLGPEVLCDTPLADLKRSDPLYAVEKTKRAFLEAVCRRTGLKPVFFNLSEFYKSGAMLSCLVLPLNYPHLARATH